ncbi:uncharacterized protein I303_107039 [Kwoniella dejecticola CBS 10117]|uniref:Uncharacterized protein n=1 Tax=Kwoniella dejecticola CBS 10117 TaxID=1296121 RepID=A0A1A5ZYK8_9TREE|nr:uncharacterized protein I303_06440 [Kwoniella dejecticola CBS 10117]OBR82883.1 hypothetical protein I303_06440 [Kwoniella dejecticola CBS 10117]
MYSLMDTIRSLTPTKTKLTVRCCLSEGSQPGDFNVLSFDFANPTFENQSVSPQIRSHLCSGPIRLEYQSGSDKYRPIYALQPVSRSDTDLEVYCDQGSAERLDEAASYKYKDWSQMVEVPLFLVGLTHTAPDTVQHTPSVQLTMPAHSPLQAVYEPRPTRGVQEGSAIVTLYYDGYADPRKRNDRIFVCTGVSDASHAVSPFEVPCDQTGVLATLQSGLVGRRFKTAMEYVNREFTPDSAMLVGDRAENFTGHKTDNDDDAFRDGYNITVHTPMDRHFNLGKGQSATGKITLRERVGEKTNYNCASFR